MWPSVSVTPSCSSCVRRSMSISAPVESVSLIASQVLDEVGEAAELGVVAEVGAPLGRTQGLEDRRGREARTLVDLDAASAAAALQPRPIRLRIHDVRRWDSETRRWRPAP